MIVKVEQRNIFDSDVKHVAFLINTDGSYGVSFASQIAGSRNPKIKYSNTSLVSFLSKLEFSEDYEIGRVISKKIDDIVFHALVCSPFREDVEVETIQNCIDKIPSNGDVIAFAGFGPNDIAETEESSLRKFICGLHDSNQRIHLHSHMTIEDVFRRYYEELFGIKTNFEDAIIQNSAVALEYAYAKERESLCGDSKIVNSSSDSSYNIERINESDEASLLMAYNEEKRQLFNESGTQFVKK